MVLYNKLNRMTFLLFDLHGVILPEGNIEVPAVDEALSDLKKNILRAEALGVKLGIISAAEDVRLLEKIKDSGITEIFSHSLDKVSQAEKLLKKYGLGFENIGFIGDDILDIPLLMKTGFSAAPRGARREVKRIVNYVARDSESKTVLSDVLDLISKARETKLNESK
ncbi:MAG TPA: HAD hydrolase family protein [Ignavibacteriales bacterium]|nr:HAD hydrolase family protein [Ignavibacteriales bacterium]